MRRDCQCAGNSWTFSGATISYAGRKGLLEIRDGKFVVLGDGMPKATIEHYTERWLVWHNVDGGFYHFARIQ